MKPSALQYLFCIKCQSALELHIAETMASPCGEDYEIVSGSLWCKLCHKTYPISGGIPRLIDKQQSSKTNLKTGHRFGLSWQGFPRLHKHYHKQFFDWLNPVRPNFIAGKVVLEAGCGKGRHAKIIAESGASLVFGIDIGDAVDVAYANIGHLPVVHIIQADICFLPFKPIFDYIFSVGVLHHVDSPATAFSSLVSCLKPNGAISIWVYGWENNWWIRCFLDPLRISITSKLPPFILRFISGLLAIPVYLWSKFIARPWHQLQSKLSWLPPLFYQEYGSYIADFDFTEIHHIVFDQLVTPISHYISKAQINKWFTDLNLVNSTIRWHNKNSWAGFAYNNNHAANDSQADRIYL